VTGASSGIGTECARELARRGYGVTLVARREERLRELAGELGEAAEVYQCDVADPAARQGLADALTERGKAVGILINDAGFSTSGPFARSDRQRELEMIRTNIEAVVDFCALFIPGMVDRGHGGVLNLASTAAFQPLPMQAGYAATKAFVLSFSDSLHAELRQTGVAVTALAPGPVRTEFTEVAGLQNTESLPDMFWDGPEEVARAGIRGLERGKRVVIPGAINRAGAIGGQYVPRSLFLPLASRVHPAGRRR
jgi:short-subunit dehydrogenase